MASIPQSRWVFPISGFNGGSYSKSRDLLLKYQTRFLTLHTSATPSGSGTEDEPAVPDPVKLAFEKAKAYKKGKSLNPNPIPPNPTPEPTKIQQKDGETAVIDSTVENGDNEIPVSVKIALEKAREYKKSKEVVGSSKIVDENQEKLNEEDNPSAVEDGDKVPHSVKLALQKASEYKKKKEALSSSKNVEVNQENVNFEDDPTGAVEKIVDSLRDGIVEGRFAKRGESISNIDFVGLGFSEKKSSRNLPAGLVPVTDPFGEGELPEVEIIVGDASKFGVATTPIREDDDSDLYKPTVSTWGVFPRPSNISKTYGGGKVIRPGDVLETAEEKAAKEARTRQLLASYKKKSGLTIDPKAKSECEKALRDGDQLMELGKLKEALPYYEKVMKNLVFQSELHGLAALQWSICQDSLSRTNEARTMYEKLRSHSNVQVRKKARQFLFGFEAMELMKITSSSPSPKMTGYQNYFEAFVEDKASYSPKEEEQDVLGEALPYIIFLVSPIFFVLFIAVSKGI